MKIIGVGKYKIGDYVAFKTPFMYSRGPKGEIVDLRVKRKRGLRVIQYKVLFKSMTFKYRKKPEYWFIESDLERWRKKYKIQISIERLIEWIKSN